MATIQNVEAFDSTATVYNFEVENTHTYYVGTEGVLVHNSCQVEALSKLYPNVEKAIFDDFKTAINAVSETTIPTALRVPFYQELAKLDDAALKAFIQDFKSADLDFRAGLLKEPSFIDVWKNVKSLTKVRSSIGFLRELKKITDDNSLIEHIFKGDFRNVTGCHFLPAVDNVNVRFANNITLSTASQNSLGVVKADIEMLKPLLDQQLNVTGYKWVLKNTRGEPQTFFPSNWSKDRILEEIASAISNPNKALVQGKSRMYYAQSESGVIMRWFSGTKNPSGYESIFPQF